MSKKYVDSDGHDHVMCPLIEEYIEDIECIINRDVVDELLKERVMQKKFKKFEGWREVCNKCEWHNY